MDTRTDSSAAPVYHVTDWDAIEENRLHSLCNIQNLNIQKGDHYNLRNVNRLATDSRQFLQVVY